MDPVVFLVLFIGEGGVFGFLYLFLVLLGTHPSNSVSRVEETRNGKQDCHVSVESPRCCCWKVRTWW